MEALDTAAQSDKSLASRCVENAANKMVLCKEALVLVVFPGWVYDRIHLQDSS